MQYLEGASIAASIIFLFAAITALIVFALTLDNIYLYGAVLSSVAGAILMKIRGILHGASGH